MQSGIRVSRELHDAFNQLVSKPDQRGLIATIEAETIRPQQTIPSSSPDFSSDLPALQSLLPDKQAAYILLRRYSNVPDGYVAVTFVPDAAPVRQKMLFASTRLTLVRELGTERFRETLFATELSELEKGGREEHDAIVVTSSPLTQEEETLKGVKEAEAEARGGTHGKRLETGGKLTIEISDEARSALEGLRDAAGGTLVQLRVDTKKESVELVQTSETDADGLGSAISENQPRYSLYKCSHSFIDGQENPLVFIYTCPPGLGVRDRMLYATSKGGFLTGLEKDLKLEVSKKFEVTSPSEISASTLSDVSKPVQEQKQGFSRPKRPGKR